MNDKRYQAIIVGGGPAGLSAGIELARRGVRTLLVEQREEVGVPVQCGEAVSRLFMEESGMSPDLPWVVAPVHRLRMVMPNRRSVSLEREGYCIRRDAFDAWLFGRYVDSGGDARLGEKVLGAAEESGRVRLWTTGGAYTAGAVVAADGPLSRVAVLLGLRTNVRCISAIQYKFSAGGELEAGTLSFYFSGEIAGGYYWIFPRGEEVSIGVGGQERRMLRGALEAFCRRHGYDPSTRLTSHGGLIPSGWPLGRLASDRAVVCGDAAGLVHPASKGGIHLAVHSGRAAGEAVAGLLGSAAPLSAYAREIAGIEAFKYPYFRRLQSALFFTDREYNLIGEIGGRGGRVRFYPVVVLGRPSSWPLLPRLLGLYRAYTVTARWMW